ncbi:MAG: nitrate reductase molybdenum cofactor assembly chaperone [Ectothiorhodospiraceae bacterium]|nr:nitrate reductase molybdenum cofactor assembly chaperone [Ectothiorhodospiraceae bacterium]
MRTLKALAVLLHYPTEELLEHAHEVEDMIGQDGRIGSATRRALADLLHRLGRADLLDVQAEYVGLFDRSCALSLHLFEHLHGESRDRGQAMVELSNIYREHGFHIAANELPDYLPMFLEFCSMLPEEEARDWLQQSAHLLQLLHGRLRHRESDYAMVFQAVLELGEIEGADVGLEQQILDEQRDDTPEALDAVWAEEPVIFGPTEGCGGARTHTGQAVPVDTSQLRRSREGARP